MRVADWMMHKCFNFDTALSVPVGYMKMIWVCKACCECVVELECTVRQAGTYECSYYYYSHEC